MKKLLMPIALLLLIGIAGFVYAMEMRVNLAKGWNLVYGLNTDNPVNKILSGSEILSNDIKAIYVYLPNIKQYGRLYPNPEIEKITNNIITSDLEQSVFWVYSTNGGSAKINVDEPLPIKDRELYAGWNFIPVVPELIGKNINESRGTCVIEKAYGWDYNLQGDGYWNDLLDEKLPSEASGLGFILKVKESCKLGEPAGAEEPLTSLPQIPN